MLSQSRVSVEAILASSCFSVFNLDITEMEALDMPDDIWVLLLCDWMTIREWGTLLMGSAFSRKELLMLMKSNVCNTSLHRTSVYWNWAAKHRIQISAIALDVNIDPCWMHTLDTSKVVTISAFGFYYTKFIPQNNFITELNLRCSFVNSELLTGFLKLKALKRISFVSLDFNNVFQTADAIAEKHVAKILRNNANLESVYLAKFYSKSILNGFGRLENLVELRIEHISQINRNSLVYLLNLFNQNKKLRKLLWKSVKHWFYWELGGNMDFQFTLGCPKEFQNLLKALTSKCTALYCEIKPLKHNVMWSLHNCTPSLSVVHYRTPDRRENVELLSHDDVLKAKFSWTTAAFCDVLHANDYEFASYWDDAVRMPYWYMCVDDPTLFDKDVAYFDKLDVCDADIF